MENHGTTQGRQGKNPKLSRKIQRSPKITCFQEARKALKLQSVQGIVYRTSRGRFLWQKNSREDQNTPQGSRGMREFLPAPLGCAAGAVRAPRAPARAVSICNVHLAINSPAPTPRPFPHGKNVPQAPNIPGFGGGHGKGREKNRVGLAGLKFIEF